MPSSSVRSLRLVGYSESESFLSGLPVVCSKVLKYKKQKHANSIILNF